VSAHYRSPAQTGIHQAGTTCTHLCTGAGLEFERHARMAATGDLSTIQAQRERAASRPPNTRCKQLRTGLSLRPRKPKPAALVRMLRHRAPRHGGGTAKEGIGLHTLARRATALGMALPVMAPKMLGGWFSCGCAPGRHGAAAYRRCEQGPELLIGTAARQSQSTSIQHATACRSHARMLHSFDVSLSSGAHLPQDAAHVACGSSIRPRT